MGAVAWEGDVSAEEVLAFYQNWLEGEGYELRLRNTDSTTKAEARDPSGPGTRPMAGWYSWPPSGGWRNEDSPGVRGRAGDEPLLLETPSAGSEAPLLFRSAGPPRSGSAQRGSRIAPGKERSR